MGGSSSEKGGGGGGRGGGGRRGGIKQGKARGQHRSSADGSPQQTARTAAHADGTRARVEQGEKTRTPHGGWEGGEAKGSAKWRPKHQNGCLCSAACSKAVTLVPLLSASTPLP